LKGIARISPIQTMTLTCQVSTRSKLSGISPVCTSLRPSPRPLYGAPFVKPIFWSSCFFNLLVPFLGSTESRFFVPTCHGSMTPRANAVKDGRRAGGSTSSAVARPRLDGGEHGVTLRWSGPRHTHSFFNLSVRESLCSGSVDKPWFKAKQSEASLPSWRADQRAPQPCIRWIHEGSEP
jgi:hypothetical protein